MSVLNTYQMLGNSNGVFGSIHKTQQRFAGQKTVILPARCRDAVTAVPGFYWHAVPGKLVPVAECVYGGKYALLDQLTFGPCGTGGPHYFTPVFQSFCSTLLHFHLHPQTRITGNWHNKGNRTENGYFRVNPNVLTSVHKLGTQDILQHTQYSILGTVSKTDHDFNSRACGNVLCVKAEGLPVAFAYLVFGCSMCTACWQRNVHKQACLGEVVSSRTAKQYVHSLTPEAAAHAIPCLSKMRRTHFTAAMDEARAQQLDWTDSDGLQLHGTAVSYEWLYFPDVYIKAKAALHALPPFMMGCNVGRMVLAHCNGRRICRHYKHIECVWRQMQEQRDRITQKGTFTVSVKRTQDIDFEAAFLPYVRANTDLPWTLQPWHQFVFFVDRNLGVYADYIKVLHALLTRQLHIAIELCPPVELEEMAPPLTPKEKKRHCRTPYQFVNDVHGVQAMPRRWMGEALTWSYLARTLDTYAHLCNLHANVHETAPLKLRIVGSYINALNRPTYDTTPCITYGTVFQTLVDNAASTLAGSVTVSTAGPQNNTMRYMEKEAAEAICASIRAQNACFEAGCTANARATLLDLCQTIGVPTSASADPQDDACTLDPALLQAAQQCTVMAEDSVASAETSAYILDNLKAGLLMTK